MKVGRKRHAPTPEKQRLVSSLSAFGVREDDIAREIGIDPTTLRKYYRDELDLGHVRANAKVAESLFKMATSGENVVAAIFWLKTRAQWREPRAFDMPPPVNQEDDATADKVFTLRVFDGGKPVQPLTREPVVIEGRAIEGGKANGHVKPD